MYYHLLQNTKYSLPVLIVTLYSFFTLQTTNTTEKLFTELTSLHAAADDRLMYMLLCLLFPLISILPGKELGVSKGFLMDNSTVVFV